LVCKYACFVARSQFKNAQFRFSPFVFHNFLQLTGQLSSMISITALFSRFSNPMTLTKKGPRGFRRQSKSREEMPEGRAATAGAIACRHIPDETAGCLDGSQFWSRL
jgi:hypothetical protein